MCSATVSYTHLDVYKRQYKICAVEELDGEELIGEESDSVAQRTTLESAKMSSVDSMDYQTCLLYTSGNIILFKSYFGICYLKRYYYYQIKYFLISGIIFLIVSIVENRIRFQNIFYSLLSRAIIGAFLTIVLYLMFYWKSKIFKDAIRMIVNQSEKIS